MSFSIQTSSPSVNLNRDPEGAISDLLEDLFPLMTEDAILAWNGVRIPLSYKYDIPYMLADILELISCLYKRPSGELFIGWSPNTFRSDWNLAWDNDDLLCRVEWFCLAGHVEKALPKQDTMRLDKMNFIAEWGELLRQVVTSTSLAEIDLEAVDGGELVLNTVEKIHRRGVLYRD